MPDFKNKEEYEKWKTERLKNISEKGRELKNSGNNVPVQENKTKSRNKIRKVFLTLSVLFSIFVLCIILFYYYYYKPKKVAEDYLQSYRLNDYLSSVINISGMWSGIVTSSNGESVLLEFTVTQDKPHSMIDGNGFAQVSGSAVKSFYTVFGSFEYEKKDDLHLLFHGSDIFIKFQGTAGASTMTGKVIIIDVGGEKERDVTFTKK